MLGGFLGQLFGGGGGSVGGIRATVGADITDYERKMRQADQTMKRTAASMSAELDKTSKDVKRGLADLLPSGAGALLGGAAALGIQQMAEMTISTVKELNTLGAQSSRLSAAFTQQWGERAPAAMETLRAASHGAISDMDLMLSANRAKMLHVTDDYNELGRLLEVASARGRAMGLTTQQAFNDLVTGIGRISPLILDNLGILTGGEATFNAYAESIGKVGAELTDVEKRQALVNKVLEESVSGTMDAAGKQEAWAAQTANAKAQLGMLVSTMIEATGILPVMTSGVVGLTDALRGINDQTVTVDQVTASWHETMERAKGSLNLVQEAQYANWLRELSILYRIGVLDLDEYTAAVQRSEEAVRAAAGMTSTATEEYQKQERAFLDAQWAANGYGTEVVKSAKESAAETARLTKYVEGLKGSFDDGALSAKELARAQNGLGVSTDTLKGKVLNLAGAYDALKRSAWASMAAQRAAEGPYSGSVDTSGQYPVYDTAYDVNVQAAVARQRLINEAGVQARRDEQSEYDERLRAQKSYATDSLRLAEQQFQALRGIVESALSPTAVTAADLAATAAGTYVDKWDEYMRRVRMPESGMGADQIAEQERLFYSGQMMDQVNWEAVVSDVQRKVQEEASREAMIQEAMRQVQMAGIGATQSQVAGALGVTDYAAIGQEQQQALAAGFRADGLAVTFTDQFEDELGQQQERWVTMGRMSVEWMAEGIELGATPEVTHRLLNVLVPQVAEALTGGVRP